LKRNREAEVGGAEEVVVGVEAEGADAGEAGDAGAEAADEEDEAAFLMSLPDFALKFFHEFLPRSRDAVDTAVETIAGMIVDTVEMIVAIANAMTTVVDTDKNLSALNGAMSQTVVVGIGNEIIIKVQMGTAAAGIVIGKVQVVATTKEVLAVVITKAAATTKGRVAIPTNTSNRRRNRRRKHPRAGAAQVGIRATNNNLPVTIRAAAIAITNNSKVTEHNNNRIRTNINNSNSQVATDTKLEP